MADGIGFKEGLQIEKDKFKRMDWPHRWDYFKTYYLKMTIVIILIIIAAISMTRGIIKNKRQVLLGAYFANVRASDEFYTYINEDYFAYLGGNEKKQQMDIATDQNLDIASYDNTTYASEMALIAQVTTGSIDAFFCDTTVFERELDQYVYADLSQILTEEEMEALSDYLVYVEDEEGNSYPGAIKLNDTELAEKYDFAWEYGEDAYLCIMVNGENYDNSRTFLEYLFFNEN